MGANHIVYTADGVLKCLHCGKTFVMPEKIFVSEFTILTTTFIEDHLDCKEPA
jgi:hypothetical protein